MAQVSADRVKESTATTGTGTVTLGGAFPGFQTFLAGIATGNTCNYCLVSGNGTDWETGTGTYTSGANTLSRTTVFESSNSGSKINLSGTSTAFVTAAANHIVSSTDLDNAFGSTQGQILYRGASAWSTLSPGISGQFLKTQGTAANPVWDTPAGGGSGGLFSGILGPVPTQANTGLTTWGNQGSATATDTAVGIQLAAPSNGNTESIKIIYKAAPATPYKITALIGLTSSFVNTEHAVVMLGFYNGSKTNHIGHHIGSNGSDPLGSMTTANYTNLTTSSSGFDYGAPSTNPFWVQIEDDGSAIHMRFGVDGISWKPLIDQLYAASWIGASPTFVFFGINPFGCPIYGGTLLSYVESA